MAQSEPCLSHASKELEFFLGAPRIRYRARQMYDHTLLVTGEELF
jgi:hypothetical protein